MKYTREELQKILDLHEKWQMDIEGGARADLSGADLRGADLRGSYLYRADFHGADLRGADLYRADLRGANLCGANLYRADLRGADLENATGVPGIACPEKGSFIGFKKARCIEVEGEPGNLDKVLVSCIIELEIEKDALRSSATTRKCRCSKAKVLSITDHNGYSVEAAEAFSIFDCSFKYRVGEIVEVADFDTDRWNECAPGIHFFITRQEAVDY